MTELIPPGLTLRALQKEADTQARESGQPPNRLPPCCVATGFPDDHILELANDIAAMTPKQKRDLENYVAKEIA
jgi:hypothetical protein